MFDPLTNIAIRRIAQVRLDQGVRAANHAAEQMVRYQHLFDQWKAEWEAITEQNRILREQLTATRGPLKIVLADFEHVGAVEEAA